MDIKVRYLKDGEIKRIKGGDWIDLQCSEDTYMRQGDIKAIPLGVAIQVPAGYEAWLVPRSSTCLRYGVISANSIGIIDESYCGDEDQLHFLAYATKPTLIKAGERICQIRIIKHQPDINFVRVETLGNPNRGGLGSTG